MNGHGPLGSWPLECWVFDCAQPRVSKLHCERHALQAATSERPFVPLVAPRAGYGQMQADLLALLRLNDRPMRVTDLARVRGADPSLTCKALGRLIEKGHVRKISIGTYAAVWS